MLAYAPLTSSILFWCGPQIEALTSAAARKSEGERAQWVSRLPSPVHACCMLTTRF